MKSKKPKVPFSFPGGSVVKNPPANGGDLSSIPGSGRSHMPWSVQAGAPQLWSRGGHHNWAQEPYSLCSAGTRSHRRERPTQQCRPGAAMTKPYFLPPKAHSQNQAQKPVPGFYLLWSQWSSASFLPLQRKNYRRQTQRKQRAKHSTGMGSPESNNFTATASEHSMCIKRENSTIWNA